VLSPRLAHLVSSSSKQGEVIIMWRTVGRRGKTQQGACSGTNRRGGGVCDLSLTNKGSSFFLLFEWNAVLFYCRETILVGFTTKTDQEINQVIQTLSKEFTGTVSLH
jgi:hypothetical protein